MMKRTKRRGVTVVALASALALLLSPAAWAGDDDTPAKPTVTQAHENHRVQPIRVNGLTAFFDAETGAVTAPTREQLAAFNEALQQWLQTDPEELRASSLPFGGVREIQLDNGMVKARVPFDRMSFSTVRVNKDGTLTYGSVKPGAEADSADGPEEQQ